MTRTSGALLAATGIIAAALGFAVEVILVRVGEPVFIPPLTLGGALFLLGVVITSLAWPIRRHTGVSAALRVSPVNPFYATRVLLLAKASSVTGALLAGLGLGIVDFLASRMVVVWPSLLSSGAVLLGGSVLVVGSVLAEKWCFIPPDDQDSATDSREHGQR